MGGARKQQAEKRKHRGEGGYKGQGKNGQFSHAHDDMRHSQMMLMNHMMGISLMGPMALMGAQMMGPQMPPGVPPHQWALPLPGQLPPGLGPPLVPALSAVAAEPRASGTGMDKMSKKRDDKAKKKKEKEKEKEKAAKDRENQKNKERQTERDKDRHQKERERHKEREQGREKLKKQKGAKDNVKTPQEQKAKKSE